MKLKQILMATCLAASGLSVSAGAAVITNNVSNWDGVTNTVTGGRWSYLSGSSTTPSDLSSVGLLGQQYNNTPDNWCVDNQNFNYVWYVQSNGITMTDSRNMVWNYTNAVSSGDASDATISGTYGHHPYWEFAIFKTTDTNQGVIDLSTKQLLFYSNSLMPSGNIATFNLNTSMAPGNDILFVSNTFGEWWVPRYLDATITIVPEPAALGLLALGGLVLFRRRG